MSEDGDTKPPVTALQDLIAGGIAGSVSVCIGHPFDTYKVMMQTSATGTKPSFSSVWSLFRGIGAPLSTAAVVNAIIFSSYGESSRLYDDFFLPQQEKSISEHDSSSSSSLNGKDDESCSTSDHQTFMNNAPRLKSILCGSFAGAVQSLVICPAEHIKCRLQIQNKDGYKGTKFKGSLDALDKILNIHGIRGLYRGFTITLWREVPAFAMYFSVYDFIKEKTNNLVSRYSSESDGKNQNNGSNSNSLHIWASSSLAGGISGAVTWLSCYYPDVVKTRIQTCPFDTPIEKRRIHYVVRQIFNDHGWRYFFRGLGVTLLRAFPVNAIIFPTYEFTLMQMTKHGIGVLPVNESAI